MSLNLNKDIVIGSGTFTKVVQSSAFIDKTNFIYEFLTNRIEVILTTAPRRFGKTVIMNMVKLFLEIQLDEQNKIIKKEETYSYKVFTQQYRNKVLNISTANDLIRSHLACYPVIYLTFYDLKESKYVKVLKGIRSALYNSFEPHFHLKQSKELSSEQLIYLETYGSIEKFDKLDEEEIKRSLRLLCKLLYKHFKKRVYVLVDEYDGPVNFSIQTKSNDIDKINAILNSIYCSVFKDNEYLEKGFITGISDAVKTQCASGLNNITHFGFLKKHEFNQFYGFNQMEVNQLFMDFKIDPLKQKEAIFWYDGYTIESEETSNIFNVWSIINFVKSNQIKNYWPDTGNLSRSLFRITEIEILIENLIEDDFATFTPLEKLSVIDIKRLQELFDESHTFKLSEEYLTLFLSYFLLL